MAEGKRYYWLRLHDDFFSSVRIKKLRKMAGGDTYVIIYLKMQLKAIKSDGVLSWKGYEQDFVEELALDLDEEPDNVRVTLAYLVSCGLAETEDNINFFLPYAMENTGSEGASAERMRNLRARQASQSDRPVTQPLRLSDGEKEKEKEKEIEKETKEIERNSTGDTFETVFQEYVEHRNSMGKPLMGKGIEYIRADLERLAPGDKEKQIAILRQSIDRGWKGVFPLKTEPKKNGPPMKTQYDKQYAEPIDDDLDHLAKMLGVEE